MRAVAVFLPLAIATPMSDIKARALIVDDSRTVAAMMRMFLQRQGFEVLVAADGVVGLEMAIREQPQVILTDFYMPGMNGPDMVKALRGDARTRHITVFMLTSEDSLERRQQAMNAGADEYILKPYRPEILAALLRSVADRAPALHG